MDLAKLDTGVIADQGAKLHLKDPVSEEELFQDDGQPITITLAGSDSNVFRKQQRINTDRRVARAQKGKPYTAAEVQEEQIEMLIKCTLGWDGIVYGSVLEFTPENVRMLYTKVHWIREQVDLFIGNRANFLPNSNRS